MDLRDMRDYEKAALIRQTEMARDYEKDWNALKDKVEETYQEIKVHRNASIHMHEHCSYFETQMRVVNQILNDMKRADQMARETFK